jgi:DNA repair protein RadC
MGKRISQNQSHPQENDLPPGLSNPARRALATAGIQNLTQLTQFSEADIKKLHGIGPNALNQLRHALAASDRSFADVNRGSNE